jgi:molybdate/tungstate transport system substrate-binding protein
MSPRRGVSRAVAFSALFAVVLILVTAYFYSSREEQPPGPLSSSSLGGQAPASSPMITYCADAYAPEVDYLLRGFSSSTGTRVAPLKAGASFADANQIAAGAPDDVFVSVAMSATSPQYLKGLSANWTLGFASDQMVLAYSNTTQSPAAAGVIDLGDRAEKTNATSDWDAFFAGLTSGGVKVGIASPTADPAGLRGWLVLEAAGYLYSGGDAHTFVESMLKAGGNVTGASAAALVSPLESGQIQFLFAYKSAAVSDGLPFIALDDHVNLGSPALGSFYSMFSYVDSAGTTAGAPIALFVTVPRSSANSAEALQFVQYVVKNAGSLSGFGLQPFPVPKLYHNGAPPAAIQAMVSLGLVADAGPLQ